MSAHGRPQRVSLQANGRLLALHYPNRTDVLTSCQLRVASPSAELKVKGVDYVRLAAQKAAVRLVRIVPVGHYALRLIFDDGHQSGLYDYELLSQLSGRE